MGKLTANGLSVAALHFTMCSSKISGYIDPEPIMPNPPALDTADASSHPEHQIIPAWMMGYSILNREVIRFFIIVDFTIRTIKSTDLRKLRLDFCRLNLN